ncbi:histidine kinase [Xylanimonas cellulosilytica DSM 15894]|uniref:histidine kinase n=1 Tax=Xylanimonas cellulosilytica (strain DSM 15894 / JCM 12276 / CECT 5975 / KCTC 9989 / LMG 20990 / NBRC 107835 / XIL07) TaxID=446471 RepID=D1BX46_XYLCX|nr:histidine kinase [Xylanimonas cellulosilytica]ACZ31614.1 histidine kinase [Xylanimonas cellulosilytica DSM 15894]
MGWHERVSAWADEHRFGIDAVWTAVLGVPAALVSSALAAVGRSWSDPGNAIVALWGLALVAPLAWRRVRPVGSTAVIAVVAMGHVVVAGIPLILPADAAILVALWSVTVYGPAWAHRAALGVALLGAATLGLQMVLYNGFDQTSLTSATGFAIACGVLALAVWALGLVRRSRRETLDALRDRARRLEIERDQQATIATAAERARIAREMHDIVAHSLSVVVAQADGGRYAAAADPAAAARSLEVIAETGRAALADMRRLLGVLRSDDGGRGGGGAGVGGGGVGGTGGVGVGMGGGGSGGVGVVGTGGGVGGGTAPRAPQPGMSPRDDDGAASSGATSSGAASSGAAPLAVGPDDAELGSLLDQARGAGMTVSFVRVGEPRRLPPGAGLTLHRICQEALTNVRKHGGPGVKVTVVVRWGPTAVELEVSDDGRGAAAADDAAGGGVAGYGLLGMRERAAMFGGQVTAGPRPGGGWRVRFRMPLPSGTRELA